MYILRKYNDRNGREQAGKNPQHETEKNPQTEESETRRQESQTGEFLRRRAKMIEEMLNAQEAREAGKIRKAANGETEAQDTNENPGTKTSDNNQFTKFFQDLDPNWLHTIIKAGLISAGFLARNTEVLELTASSLAVGLGFFGLVLLL